MLLVLPNERPQSLNKLYAGQHWSYRSILAMQTHALIRASLREMGICKPQPFPYRVNITITGYFKGRILDSDNISAKMYVDGLKGILLIDDSPKYVGTVSTRSEHDNENPRVTIAITQDMS